MSHRTVKAVHAARRDDIADLKTRRPLPGPGVEQVDPFLFLNHHGPQTYPPANRGLPFGPHPHRGFETVTFILEGSLAHYDSGGHESVIAAGGVQWMTAGSGLVHAELSPEEFKRNGGDLEILQLWLNLPARLKMTPPAYTGLKRADIPALARDEGRVTLNLIAGAFEGERGPFRSLTGAFMSTVELRAGGRIVLPATAGRSVFLYVVRGMVRVADAEAGGFRLVELNGDGDTVELDATGDTILLFGHADPIAEPVVSYGPFVMNTREEIEEAIRDYQAGLLGRIS